MDVELRQLRYLVAVSDHGSIGKAASALRLTAPTVARQLTDLERRIGTALIERGRSGSGLTATGWELVERLRPALQELTGAVEDARPRVAGERLRIACQADSVNAVLAPLLRAVKQLPGIQIDAQVLPRPRQLADIAAGRLDLGFLWSPVVEPDVRVEPFYELPVCVVVSADHSAAALRQVALSELSGATWLAVRNPGGLNRDGELRARCRAAGFEPRFTRPVQDLILGLALVAAGHGVMAGPPTLAAMAPEGVRVVPIADWRLMLTATLPAGPVKPAVRRLLRVADAMLDGFVAG